MLHPSSICVTNDWKWFSEEHNIWLNETLADLGPCAVRDGFFENVSCHQVVRVWVFAVDTALTGERAMCFNDTHPRDTGSTLECIDVLGEASEQEVLVG